MAEEEAKILEGSKEGRYKLSSQYLRTVMSKAEKVPSESSKGNEERVLREIKIIKGLKW